MMPRHPQWRDCFTSTAAACQPGELDCRPARLRLLGNRRWPVVADSGWIQAGTCVSANLSKRSTLAIRPSGRPAIPLRDEQLWLAPRELVDGVRVKHPVALEPTYEGNERETYEGNERETYEGNERELVDRATWLAVQGDVLASL
jgi:hypothetical protein